MLATLIALILAGGAGTDLVNYVSAPDASFEHTLNSAGNGALTSQTWRGRAWDHQLTTVGEIEGADAAILWVTGGEVSRNETSIAVRIAERADLPVIFLDQVPNQPIFGLSEDALIAHTFAQFIATGEDNWPLLLPMVKSVVAAMDAMQEATGIERFVVTGLSKRGWTAWLTAAIGDERVIAIAPMVFDMLDMGAQLARQQELWGKYSPMIADYTELGLQAVLSTPRGQELLATVDPFSYLPRINMPVLIVLGGNDPYWALDAARLYWGDIQSPKHLAIAPNAGHDLTEAPGAWIDRLVSFAGAVVDGRDLPPTGWLTLADGGFKISEANAWVEATLWVAESPDMDFTDAIWRPVKTLKAPFDQLVELEDFRLNRAVFLELRSGELRDNTPVLLIPAPR